MKRKISRPLTLLLAILLLVFTLPILPAAADITPSFTCPNLAAAVRGVIFPPLAPGAPLTAAQAATVTHLQARGRGITSLGGLEHLPNLLVFDVSENELTQADFSVVPRLLRVDVSDNPLTSLNIANNANLTQLNAALTELTILNTASNPRLEILTIPGNPQLANWSVAQNPELVQLNVSGNGLTSLNIANNDNLQLLIASHNRLSSVNISHLTELEMLDVSHNLLTAINLQGVQDLANLNVSHNQLTSLDLTPTPWLFSLIASGNRLSNFNAGAARFLVHLDVSNNQLMHLQVMGNAVLQRLVAANNRLATLDTSGSLLLVTLDVSDNELSTLNLQPNTQLQTLDVSRNRLSELDVTALTRLRELDVSHNRIASLQLVAGLNTTQLYSFTFQPQEILGTDVTAAFTCENLLNALREVLQWGDGAPIIAEQAAQITQLDLQNRGITRLDGLQYFSGLQDLILYNNDIVYINPGAWPQLQELDVGNNGLESVNVSQNPLLQLLWVDGNNLERLDVSSNPLLISLFVSNNRLSTLDLQPNPALAELQARNNLLQSLDLQQQTALRRVDVRNNFMQSIADLQLAPGVTMTNLQTFQFHPQHGMNRDVSEFFACENFLAAIREYLNLDATDPVTPAQLQQITVLDVSGQGITSLAGLLFLTELEYLNASNNRITSVDVTANTNLQILDIRMNWLPNESAILGADPQTTVLFAPQVFSGQNITAQFACENFLAVVREALGIDSNTPIGANNAAALQTLNLQNRGITSIAGIANFTGLTTLNLADNPLQYIDLSSNVALQKLNVSGLCLSALNLTANTALTHLDISRNHFAQLNLLGNRNLTQVNATQNFFAHQSDIQLPIAQMTLQFNPQNPHTVTAPTCTTRGFTTWTSPCGHRLITNETAALGHVFTTEVTRPTFTQPGYTTRTCTRCEYSYTTDHQPPIALEYEATLELRHNQATDVFVNVARVAPELTWHSSNPEVMTVDAQGLVSYGRAPRRGVTTITATCPEGITRMGVEVTVRLVWWQWIILIFFFGFLWY